MATTTDVFIWMTAGEVFCARCWPEVQEEQRANLDPITEEEWDRQDQDWVREQAAQGWRPFCARCEAPLIAEQPQAPYRPAPAGRGFVLKRGRKLFPAAEALAAELGGRVGFCCPNYAVIVDPAGNDLATLWAK